MSIEETRSRSFRELSLTGVAKLLTAHARVESTRRSGTPCPPPLSWHRLLLPISCHLATSYTCISDFLLLQVGTHRVFTGLGWQQFITKRGFWSAVPWVTSTNMVACDVTPFTSYLDVLGNKGNIPFGNNVQGLVERNETISKSSIQVPQSIKHSCEAHWSAGCL